MKKAWFFLLLLILGTLVSCTDEKENGLSPWDFEENSEDGTVYYKRVGVLYEEYVPELVLQGNSVNHHEYVNKPYLVKYFTNQLDEKYLSYLPFMIGEVYTLPACEDVLIVKVESCYYFLQRGGTEESYLKYLGQYYGYQTVPYGYRYSLAAEEQKADRKYYSGQHILIRVEATTKETVTGTVMETGQGFTEGEVITCRYNTWVDQSKGYAHDIVEIGVERSELAEGDLIIVGTDLIDPAEKEGELLIEFIRALEEEP